MEQEDIEVIAKILILILHKHRDLSSYGSLKVSYTWCHIYEIIIIVAKFIKVVMISFVWNFRYYSSDDEIGTKDRLRCDVSNNGIDDSISFVYVVIESLSFDEI